MSVWSQCAWDEATLHHALHETAKAAGLQPEGELPTRFRSGDSEEAVCDWLSTSAHRARIEIRTVECGYSEIDACLARCAPALLQLPGAGNPLYLAVIRSDRKALVVIAPTLERRQIALAEVRAALVQPTEQRTGETIDRWLTRAGVRKRQAARARAELLRLLAGTRRVGGIWLLGADPGSSFAAQLRLGGVNRRAVWCAACSVGSAFSTIVGWALLGRSALEGGISSAWTLAWALATLSAVTLQIASQDLGARLLRDLSSKLKQRLLCGALRSEPDLIKTRGSGRLLAIVSESEALEGAGLNGAVSGVLAVVQLFGAALILSVGTAAAVHLVLLGAWCGLLTLRVQRFWRLRRAWTEERLGLARSVAENVLGHRTRAAQQRSSAWHRREDLAVQRYVELSEALDRVQTDLATLPARGWMLLGIMGLLSQSGREPDLYRLAISVGGLLQAYSAFGMLSAVAISTGSALVAWKSVAELFHAAVQRGPAGVSGLATRSPRARGLARAGADAAPILEARALRYRHRPGGNPVLGGLNLTLSAGDRILLEGPSGGGKSTLAALLLGLRAPESGQILLDGLDRTTLGASAWLHRIAGAPQFHENHVLSASLAFNLLMGRSWPPSPQDRREAQSVCEALGLGRLLSKMPAGLDQVIGETGWRLSHGERSRIFLARALLQHADVLVLDETFGALDSSCQRQCLQAVFTRSSTLILIAHP